MEDEKIEETQSEETTSQEIVEDNVKDLDTTDSQESTDEVDVEYLKAQVKELEDKNKQLYARTKKVEKKKPVKSDDNSIDNIDLAEFFATGHKREDLADVQAVMKGKDLTFTEALQDPMFTTVQEKKAIERKEKDAQLGASKSGGSGSKSLKEQASTPNLSDEEHQKLWAESVKNMR